MARTVIGVNDPKAVKRWASMLAFDASQKSYFNSRFMGRGAQAEVPVQILTDLESDAGEEIKYDLLAELRMAPIEGEDVLEGKEEAQRFYTDSVYIDQARCGVNTGGSMTRKRTLHNLREAARRQQSGWWGRLFDELLFVYLSGERGTNTNFILPVGYTGRANNSLVLADANHVVYVGSSPGRNNIDTGDKFDLGVIDKAVTKANSQGGGATGIPVLQPCKFDGNGDVYVCVMHSFQEDDMRASAATTTWMDIQKAVITAEGQKAPIFRGALGMYRGVVLHSHRNAVLFTNNNSKKCAHALFMGSQAAVVAYGSPGTNMRFDWHEETRDNGDKVVISTSSIFGVKKTTFNTENGNQDFGLFAIDTAAADR